jgi:hypothetical protein
VSSFAAGVTIWAAGRVAERLRPGAGPIAALLVASNGVVWIYAAMASSDMVGAALAIAALAVFAAAPAAVSPRRAFAIGLLLGFGVSVRYAAAFGVLFVGLWILWRGGMRAALAAALGTVVGDSPQMVASWLLVGSPLANDNWHNVYLKVVCGFDYECLQRAYDTRTMPTALEFVRERGGDVVWLGLRDTWMAGSDVLSPMLLGATQPVAWLWWWPLLLAVAGLLCSPAMRRTGAMLAAFAMLQVLAVCLAFRPLPRVLVPMLPPLLVGFAVLIRSLPRPLWRRLALAAVVAGSLWCGVQSYRQFLASQAVAEVALLRALPQILHRPIVLMTTTPLMGRRIEARVLPYMAPPQPTPQATWDAVRQRMEGAGADVFLTGRASSPHVFSHLLATPVPADFTLLRRDPDAVAFERLPPPTPWIESFAVEPASPRVGEQVVMTLRLGAEVDIAQVAAAGLAVYDATGAQSLFDLGPGAAGVYARTFDVPPVTGPWRLTPFVLGIDGNARRGAEVPMLVRP